MKGVACVLGVVVAAWLTMLASASGHYIWACFFSAGCAVLAWLFYRLDRRTGRDRS